LALGITVIGGRMLGKQQRIFRDAEGPPDLYRADDLEAASRSIPKLLRGQRGTSIPEVLILSGCAGCMMQISAPA